jgi:hypothetical protein
MAKASLYKTLISRMNDAISAGNYLEASWYSYAILEDRLRSLLRSTGGEPLTANGRPLQAMSKKRKLLETRLAANQQLMSQLTALKDWCTRRNSLAHAMADATTPIADVDANKKALGEDGAELVRTLTASAMRLKRRSK